MCEFCVLWTGKTAVRSASLCSLLLPRSSSELLCIAVLMEDGLCVSAGKEIRKAGTKLPEGQEIVLTVPAPREAAPQAEDIPLEILYEDDDLAVVHCQANGQD